MPVQDFYTKIVKYNYVIMNAEIFINGLVLWDIVFHCSCSGHLTTGKMFSCSALKVQYLHFS